MKKVNLLLPVYAAMILVIFVLPFFSFSEYSMVKNTTSHLGAQNTPNSWIMNAVFAALGAASIAEAWMKLKELWFYKIILTVFGLSLILTAVFQHAPIRPGIPFEQHKDDLHSLFATVCGASFSVFAILVPMIEKKFYKKILSLSAGLSSVVLTMLIFSLPEYAGVIQRMIFIAFFGWLIFFFSDKGNVKEKPVTLNNSGNKSHNLAQGGS